MSSCGTRCPGRELARHDGPAQPVEGVLGCRSGAALAQRHHRDSSGGRGYRKAWIPVSALADHQRVDVGGALVGDDRLEVVHVPDHRVLERDAVGAEHLAGGARDLERGVDVAELAHADVLGPQPPVVLHPAEVQREQGGPVDLQRHRRPASAAGSGRRRSACRTGPARCCSRAPPRSRRAPRRPRPRRCRSAPRSGTRAGRAARSPRAASPTAGRRTSSSSSSEVTEARSDSFLWMSWVVKPVRALGDEEAANALVGPAPRRPRRRRASRW